MNILLIVPSTRRQCQGLSAGAYARALRGMGHRVLMLYTMDRHEEPLNAVALGFDSHCLKWDGNRLAGDLKHTIYRFAADIVHVWDCWSYVLTAAMECCAISNARMVLHFEDDMIFLLKIMRGAAWSPAPLENLFRGYSLGKILAAGAECYLDRPDRNAITYDIDPLVMYQAIRTCDGMTAIWRPMRDKLKEAFNFNAHIMPPGHNPKPDMSTVSLLRIRHALLNKLGWPDDTILLGLCGSQRHLDDELNRTLEAIRQVIDRLPNIRLLIWGFDTKPKLTDRLIQQYGLAMFTRYYGAVDDNFFDMLTQLTDIHLCPGHPHPFNRVRLPSRLCSILSYGKPLVTYSAGFAESLPASFRAVAMAGRAPTQWARQIVRAVRDIDLRENMALEGRLFAARYFDVKQNASALVEYYKTLMDNKTPWLRLIEHLKNNHVKRVALFGAGLFTERLLHQGCLTEFSIPVILDEIRRGVLFGIPIRHPAERDLPQWDCLIITSDAHENVLYKKALRYNLKNIVRIGTNSRLH